MEGCDLCKMDKKNAGLIALIKRYEETTEKTNKVLIFDDIISKYSLPTDSFSAYFHCLLHDKWWKFSFD